MLECTHVIIISKYGREFILCNYNRVNKPSNYSGPLKSCNSSSEKIMTSSVKRILVSCNWITAGSHPSCNKIKRRAESRLTHRCIFPDWVVTSHSLYMHIWWVGMMYNQFHKRTGSRFLGGTQLFWSLLTHWREEPLEGLDMLTNSNREKKKKKEIG